MSKQATEELKLDNIIDSLIGNYRRDQWAIYQRDIGFHKAKSELLGNAELFFYKPNSTILKYANGGKPLNINLTNPVIADMLGDFPGIIFNGEYTLVFIDSKGTILMTYDWEEPSESKK